MASVPKMITSDVLIMGAGPAGLSAATALSRQMVTTTIFDSKAYRNDPTQHMHNLPGFDHVHPSEFRAASHKELTGRYKTNTFIERKISNLKRTADGNLFQATDSEGQTYLAKKVILATGVRDIFPADIEGYAECWGQCIFHCLFCHGYEEQDSKKAAILAQGFLANPMFAPAVAGMACRLAKEVVIYTNGNKEVASALFEAIAGTPIKATVDPRKIIRTEKLNLETDGRLAIHFEDCSKEVLGFMVHVPDTEVNVPENWRKDLGLEIDDNGNLKIVDPMRMGQTTCPGVIAAGDVAGMMKAVPHAIFAGSMAVKVASILSSLSTYIPESLQTLLSPQQKPPEHFIANLKAQLRPAYDSLIAQIPRLSELLPRKPQPTTSEGVLNRVVAEARNLLVRLENAEPSLVAAFILTLILLIRLFMSWYNRFPSWSERISPFSRSAPKNTGEVSDSDFSYITADDLAKQGVKDDKFVPSHNRDTDAVILKHKRVSYPVHFAAHSIDKGHLTVGEIRAAAAKKLELSPAEADRVKIFYRGKNLKDDRETAREVGLKSSTESELMIVVGDAPPKGESSSSEGEEEDGVDGTSESKTKKKRNRKRKSKKKKGGDSGTATPTSGYSNANIDPDATYAPASAPPPRPTPSARPQVVPQTPIEKLEALASTFHTKYVPDCVQYINNPPAEKAKREFDHKRLSETILAQILLKLDAVETEGDPAARQRRKDLVKEVQSILNKLDEVVK